MATAYRKKFQGWMERVRKIEDRYKDDKGYEASVGRQQARFNILWSNVQTLTAATFARLPKPDVSRRFGDNDQVGRVASLILERALTYEIEHYPDYRATLKQAVQDRFLGGRGTAWVRYEPHTQYIAKGLPDDGAQVTEDAETEESEETGGEEQIEYECAPVDYVHWRDFGHTVGRTWEEVTAVWRDVHMIRHQVEERFGKKIAAKLDYSAQKDDQGKDKEGPQVAVIREIWDKTTRTAYWWTKDAGVIDKRHDPLNLEGFFPCPKPLYATLVNDSLVPLPDYTLYQDQAAALDTLATRIDGLIKALRVRGTYDASQPVLSRLFEEIDDGMPLLPVENWVAYAEKGGLKNAVELVDLKPIAEALNYCYQAMDQVTNQVYQITGISDIIRGQTEASETATAQQIKGQYASLRLKDYQDQVAHFATELLRLKAQIICSQFQPQTILEMASAEQLSEEDKQLIPQAMQLLIGERVMDPNSTTPNPLRAFRVEVAADSLVYTDEQQEKQDRMEFISSAGQFIQQAGQVALQAPQLVPFMGELLKFGISGFKAGRQLEGTLDELLQQAMAPQPQQPAPPDLKVEADAAKAQVEAQVIPIKAHAEVARAQADTMRAQADMAIASTDLKRTAIEAAMPPTMGEQ